MRSIDVRRLMLATLAGLPMLAIYALHVLWTPDGLSPTGFLQSDQAYYMANAREAFDGDTFPLYSLPFVGDYTSPAVYFQPLFLVLGAIVRITSADPGLVYAAAGLLACIAAFFLALVMYDEFAGSEWDTAGWLSRFTFLWGGGVLVLAAIVAETLAPSGLPRGAALLRFDPAEGYWFLNLGRNMFYSTEAFYHAVFFAAVLLVLRRRYGGALAALLLQSLSHPFTGLQLLAIVTAFAAIETGARRRERPPVWFTAGAAVLLAAHLGYYVVFLPAVSPEHRVLQQQWTLPWVLPLASMAFAYSPAAIFMGRRFGGGGTRADPRVRFALVWCLVSLALANHELFMTPRQPLHFTRGYIWTPLALLAAPVWEGALRRLLAVRPRVAGAAAAAALLLLALADNGTWLTRIAWQIKRGESNTLYVPAEARPLYARLSEPDMKRRLLVSNDYEGGYMALVYTPLRAWYSHPFNTPNPAQRLTELRTFFLGRGEPAEWSGRRLVVVVNAALAPAGAEDALTVQGYRTIDRFGRYAVMERAADGKHR